MTRLSFVFIFGTGAGVDVPRWLDHIFFFSRGDRAEGAWPAPLTGHGTAQRPRHRSLATALLNGHGTAQQPLRRSAEARGRQCTRVCETSFEIRGCAEDGMHEPPPDMCLCVLALASTVRDSMARWVLCRARVARA